MTRRLQLAFALFVVASTDAFVVRLPHSPSVIALASLVRPMAGNNEAVDINRAKQCAENFGECSVEELEFLKNSKGL